jgi:hypothetical protein
MHCANTLKTMVLSENLVFNLPLIKNLINIEMKRIFTSLVLFFLSNTIFSQSSPAAETKTAQPSFMVVPFAREGQSLRQVYESSEEARIAITKAKEAFDKRGVNTIDLISKLKATNNNAVLQEGQASDGKDDVIALSGADIYVVVEASKNYSSSGNSANVILSAYDAVSGESLANKTGNSPKIYTENYEKLVEKAIESEIDNLLNTIQEKMTNMLTNGRTLVLNVGVAEGSSLSLENEIDGSGDLLSEIIEDWVEKNAFKSQYHMQGATSNKIVFDLVKIPVYDASGKNYRVREFSSELRKFLKSKGLTSKQTVNGNNLTFTISQGDK